MISRSTRQEKRHVSSEPRISAAVVAERCRHARAAMPTPHRQETIMTTQQTHAVATDETVDLIAADKVEGTAVYDRQGQKLGSVHGLMIDKYSGRVIYAVMSFGGFLGIGDRYHPLPWRVLTYDPAEGGYVVDLGRDLLESAPSYGASEMPDWADPTWGRSVHDYYGGRA
jgi:hypothetical protein